nr:hypothetical protein [Acetobacter vaccinii]
MAPDVHILGGVNPQGLPCSVARDQNPAGVLPPEFRQQDLPPGTGNDQPA